MRHGDLDAVEIALATARRGAAVEFGNLVELRGGGFPRHALRQLGMLPGRRNDRLAGRLHGAHVRQLGQHQAAFFVHRLGQQAVARHNPVVDVDQRSPVRPDLRPHDRRRPGDLHPEPGLRALAVIGDVALARHTVVGQPGLMPRQVDA